MAFAAELLVALADLAFVVALEQFRSLYGCGALFLAEDFHFRGPGFDQPGPVYACRLFRAAMYPHADFTAPLGADLVEAVGQVDARLFQRYVERAVAGVRPVLDELVFPVAVEHRVAFLFILAEVVLAGRTYVFDAGAGDHTPVVVVSHEYLVEVPEDVGGKFFVSGLRQGAVYAFVDIQEVEFIRLQGVLFDRFQLCRRNCRFRENTRSCASTNRCPGATGRER